MKFLTLLVLFFIGRLAESARILALFPFQAPSHNVMYESVMKGLARAGHSVDVVSHFPPKKPIPGFNHISLKGTLPLYVNNFTVDGAQILNSFSGIVNYISYEPQPNDLCNLMRLPQLQNIINTKTKYDVMITEIFGTNCFLGVAYKLKLPVIGMISSSLYPWAHDPFFDNDNPSYLPSPQSGFAPKMGFLERIQNLYIHIYSKLLFYCNERTVSEPLARKYFDDLPPLKELYFNISLVLVNSHRSINDVRPTSPAVIEVGGVHIDGTQKLPEELEVFLNSSTNGVIYFCMGSMVKSETFSIDRIQAIYDSFAELPNYKVLWKGNADEMPTGIPPNVKMLPWVPQMPTLQHPNVKAFVTHGGLMGTMEAIHGAVPMIGIPMFADQKTNVAGYAAQEIMVALKYEDITKASFSNALREVLTNPKYKSNVEKVSRLFKDRRLSPMDEAIYWVEYVIRNGGDSLKSSALHLYWFQYYWIDVGLFLLTITTLTFIVLFMIIRRVLCILMAIRWSSFSAKLKTT